VNGEGLSAGTRPESFALGLFFSRENEGGGWGGLGAVDAGPRSRGRSPTSWVPLNTHFVKSFNTMRCCGALGDSAGGVGNQIVKI